VAGTLGTIRGQLMLDASSAIAAYAAVRAANATTVAALRASSLAFLAVGKAMVGVGIVFAAAFGLAINAAAEFEKRLDFFGAVSASTAEQMERVRAKALQLGQDTRYSANQIADGFVELGKAGVNAEDILNGVGLAMANLAAAGDIDLGAAARIVTATMQTFNLTAADTVRITDLLAGAANSSIVEIEDLGVSLKYVGGVAASISVPVEDTITAIALLGKAGIRGSTAGTSLRQILVSLTGTSEKASGVLKDLGIITEDGANAFFDSAGKAKPLADIFQILQDKTAGLTEAQRLAAFKTIFNNRALASAGILSREGAAGFAEMTAEIGKISAADVAAARLDNLSGDIEILKGNIQTLLIEGGTPFQEMLRTIVQGLTTVVRWFSSLSDGTQKVIFVIIAAAGAFFIIGGAIALVVGATLAIAGAFVQIFTAIKLVIGFIRAAAVAMWALNTAMLANPIGLVIIAIIALVAVFVLLYKNSETARKIMDAVWAGMVTGFKAVVAFFQGVPAFFSNLWNNIKSITMSVWNAITTFFTSTIPGFFSAAWATILGGVLTFVTAMVGFWMSLPGRILAIVSALIEGIVSFFSQLPGRVGFIIGFLIGFVIGQWLNFAGMMVNLAMTLVNGVIDAVQALPGIIIDFFTFLVNTVISLAQLWLSTVVSLATGLFNGVVNIITRLPGMVIGFFTAMANGAIALARMWLSTVVSLASGLYNGVTGIIRGLPGAVAGFFSSMLSLAQGIFNSLVSAARSMASNIYSGITSGLNALPGAVSGIFGRVLSAFKGIASRAVNAAKDFGAGLWSGFKKGIGLGSPSYIERAMWQITGTIEKETERMRSQVKTLQGLGNGIAQTKIDGPQFTSPELDAAYVERQVQQMAAQMKKVQTVQDFMSTAQRDSELASAAMQRQSLMLAGKNVAIRSETPEQVLTPSERPPVNIEINEYNPVAEPSSVATTKIMTRLGQLGVLG
jgi:TP901 family phage tail tape measure protein